MRIFRGVALGLALLAAGCATTAPEATGTRAVQVSTAGATSLNAFREANGRAPLARSAKLQRAAEAHARDMAQMDRMIHRGSDGSAISDRVKRQGYRFGKVAENIAKTGRGQARAMQIWIDSPPHRSNMLMRDATQYGLAQSGDYWAMVVARPR